MSTTLSKTIRRINGHLKLINSLPSCEKNLVLPCPTSLNESSGSEIWGITANGETVELFTLINKNGVTAKVTTFGATLTELHVPGKNGQFDDVVHGYSSLDPYLKGTAFFGCTVGRYANRIAKGKFTIRGKEYSLAINNEPNHLHGGFVGFDKRVWGADPNLSNEGGPSVSFSYRSVDGEEGYPGNVTVKVTYTLTHSNELRIDYLATSDKITPINLTNHSYFNLAGQKSNSILEHQLELEADYYTPPDDTSIPIGKITSVKGTPFDFLTPESIGCRINKVPGPAPGGYDHNYVLRKHSKNKPELAARVYEPISGRIMEVYTTEPGVQFYTGNFLGEDEAVGKGGMPYKFRSGFCLECQNFPDAVNQSPPFPSALLYPGKLYRQTTIYKFGL